MRKVLCFVLLVTIFSCKKESKNANILGTKFDNFDNSNDFTLQGNKWNKPNLTFAFDFGFTGSLNEDKKQAFRNAVQTWDNAISSFSINEINDPSQADFVFGIGGITHGNCPHNFSSNALAHGFFPPPNSGTLAGDVHINNSYSWSTNKLPNTFDIETVCLHEIGHALGLKHSSDVNSVMTANYSGIRQSLAQDDMNAICQLYQCNQSIVFPALLLDVNFNSNNLKDYSNNNLNAYTFGQIPIVNPTYVSGINGNAIMVHNQDRNNYPNTGLGYSKYLPYYQDLTYSFWLKLNYSDYYLGNTNALRFDIDRVGYTFFVGYGMYSLSDRNWHHVVIRNSPTISELFIDGISKNIDNIVQNNFTYSTINLTFQNPSYDIGYIIQFLDQIKIYNGYLTNQQINYLYQNKI